MRSSELTEIMRLFVTPRLAEIKELFFKNRTDFETIKNNSCNSNAELKKIRVSIEKYSVNTEENRKDINELKDVLGKACDDINGIKKLCESIPNIEDISMKFDETCEMNNSVFQKSVGQLVGNVDESLFGVKELLNNVKRDLNNINDNVMKNKENIKVFKHAIDENNSKTDANSSSVNALKDEIDKYSEQLKSIDIGNKLDNVVSDLEKVTANLDKSIGNNNFELQKVTNKLVSQVTEDKQLLNNTAKQLTKIPETMAKDKEELQGILVKTSSDLSGTIEASNSELKNAVTKNSSELQNITNNIVNQVSEYKQLLNNSVKQIKKLPEIMDKNRDKLQSSLGNIINQASDDDQLTKLFELMSENFEVMDKNKKELHAYFEGVVGQLSAKIIELKNNYSQLRKSSEKDLGALRIAVENLESKVSDITNNNTNVF